MKRKAKRTSLLSRLRRGRRGQAMVAYAVITAALLTTGVVFSMKILPDLLDAYDAFTKSLYFSINAPLP